MVILGTMDETLLGLRRCFDRKEFLTRDSKFETTVVAFSMVSRQFLSTLLSVCVLRRRNTLELTG
jgi:hypothetical protein